MQEDGSEYVNIPNIDAGIPKSILTPADICLIIFWRVASFTYAGTNPFTYIIPMEEAFAVLYKICGWERNWFFDALPFISGYMALHLAKDNLKKYGGLALKKEYQIIRKRQAIVGKAAREAAKRKEESKTKDSRRHLVEDDPLYDSTTEEFNNLLPEARQIIRTALARSDEESPVSTPVKRKHTKKTSNKASNNCSFENVRSYIWIFMAVTLKATGASLSFSNNLLKWGASENAALACALSTVLFNGGAGYLFLADNKEKNKNFWPKFRQEHGVSNCSRTDDLEAGPATTSCSLTIYQLFYFACVVIYSATNPFPFTKGVNDGIAEFYKDEADWFPTGMLCTVSVLSIPLIDYNFRQYWPMAKDKIQEYKNGSNQTSCLDPKIILDVIKSILFYVIWEGAGNIMKGTASSMSFSKSCIKWGLDDDTAFVIGAIFLLFNIGSSHLFFSAKKTSPVDEQHPKASRGSLEFFKNFFFGKRWNTKFSRYTEHSTELSIQSATKDYDSFGQNHNLPRNVSFQKSSSALP